MVACLDGDLVADTVAVIVGLTAGFFANGSEPGPPQVSPEETVAFSTDVELMLGITFRAREQEVPAATACGHGDVESALHRPLPAFDARRPT